MKGPDTSPRRYLEPDAHAAAAFFGRDPEAAVVMLNLLRFRNVADYSHAPHLAPDPPISGEEAYRIYVDRTLPLLEASGGEVLFHGTAGPFLIGPSEERWDAALLVRQSSKAAFLAFASDPDYLEILHHRTAALLDSRLLPLTPRV